MAEPISPVFGVQLTQDVTQRLSTQDIEVLNSLSTPGQTSPISVSEFLTTLFSRAPHDVLKAGKPEDVARVIKGCTAAIHAKATAPHQIAITIGQGLQGPALYIALSDCPFIVSSIAERLADARVTVEAFQHPIFLCNSAALALSYIEISQPETELELTPLIASLRDTLSSLQAIVSDFESMRSVIAGKCELPKTGVLRSPFGDLDSAEVRDFLRWLSDGSFFFLGTAFWNCTATPSYSEGCGAYRVAGDYRTALETDVREDIGRLLNDALDISIRKLRLNSSVHRPATVLNILLKLHGDPDSILSISGYLTSKAWAHEAEDIPILRKKVSLLVEQERVLPNTHDYKYTIEVIDNMPTDEALSMPVADMAEIARLALGLFSSQVMRTKMFLDAAKRRAFTVIVLPPDRYSATIKASMQSSLEHALGASEGSSDVHIDSSKRRQLRLYFSTPLPHDFSGALPEDHLARTFIQASLTWEERLIEALPDCDDEQAIRGIFPQDYQAATDTQEAASDLTIIESLSAAVATAVSLFSKAESHKPPVISIFSLGTTISISHATPVLENIGLEVLSAHSYTCTFRGKNVFLLKLAVRTYDGEALVAKEFNAAVAPGLTEILAGRALSDPLNLLLRKAPFTVRDISVLRAYCALLWQIQKISTKRTMWESLASSPDVAHRLFTIFDTKCNPSLSFSADERRRAIQTQSTALMEALRKVPDITHDRVLRALSTLVLNTVRTNFYGGTDTLAFKITPQTIEFMPHPRPLFEIFVFSPRIEGTHLRSAKVARGGIRWSDRTDDYRAEVLGLMKTQKVKNVIIVPSGAKGGFIVKSLPLDQDLIPTAVERGYREYITALLTLADNDTGQGVVHPPGCIVYDELDPYFVVAADKGTATFSDTANSIAQKDFSFWLGDAFASGGSQGYDHKKYGITAKGGWECVLRHFRDLSIKYETQTFTTVGIGDMSGDVFGNALLLSCNAALIAAFNHRHIFIDPTPNLAQAFTERERLFSTPRSQWSDYRKELISAGGGIFSRFEKEIVLSPEIRAALSIPENVPPVVDGETLITHILKAQVDLLWNGGIGTYVKARSESHSDVNDGTNDRVRVDADQLRAKVVGEGGNLGFTQRARIEFAATGGRINTDAIDNSGGVDLSDHEVNLKLLFTPLVRTGALSLEERNLLLHQMASDVVAAVLSHNRDQALMLSIAQLRSPTVMEQYRSFIRDMHRLGFLDRVRDSLPDDEEIDERISQKSGLSRPELAFCSAAIKMWIKEELCRSELCEDHFFENVLLEYFPNEVRARFAKAILVHPLRTEIIASELVNSIIPVVDIPFILTTATSSGHSVPTVIANIGAAQQILGLPALLEKIRLLDRVESVENFIKTWKVCGNTLRQASSWLVNVHGNQLSPADLVQLYRPSFEALVTTAQSLSETRDTGPLSELDQARLHVFSDIVPTLETLWTAHEFKGDVCTISKIFSSVVRITGVHILLELESTLTPANKWEQELIKSSYQEIRRCIAQITGKLFGESLVTAQEIEAALTASNRFNTLRASIQDIQQRINSKRAFEIAALPVVARQLRSLCL